MKNAHLYVWNETGTPFGIFTDKAEAEKALQLAADDIKVSIDSLKADLYYYEMPLNKLFLVEYDLEVTF